MKNSNGRSVGLNSNIPNTHNVNNMVDDKLIIFSENSDRRGRFYSLVGEQVKPKNCKETDNSFGLRETLSKEKSNEKFSNEKIFMNSNLKSKNKVFQPLQNSKSNHHNDLSNYLKENQALPIKSKKTTISLFADSENKENQPEMNNRISLSSGPIMKKNNCFSSLSFPLESGKGNVKTYQSEEQSCATSTGFGKDSNSSGFDKPLDSRIKSSFDFSKEEKKYLLDFLQMEKQSKDLTTLQKLKLSVCTNLPVYLSPKECQILLNKEVQKEEMQDSFNGFEQLLGELINYEKTLRTKFENT